MVRHLHDLYFLHKVAIRHPDFKPLVLRIIQQDDNRAKSIIGLDVKEKFSIVMGILKKDSKYAQEYDQFVKGMSYPAGSPPEYVEVLAIFKRLATHVLEQ